MRSKDHEKATTNRFYQRRRHYKVLKETHSKFVRLNSLVSFRLEVKAVGKPMPKGKWLKHGEEIKPSNEFMIENFEDGTSILTITEVYPDDTGEIVYEAQNPLGVAVTSTELVVESVEGTYTKNRPELMKFALFSASFLLITQKKNKFSYTFTQI